MTEIRIKTVAVMALFALLGACAKSPQATSDKFMARGEALIEKHEYSRALLEFRSAAKALPNNAEAYYQIGNAAVGAGDLKTAVGAYRRALALNPHHAGAQLRIAQLEVNGDEALIREAESGLRALLESSSPTTEMLNTLALTELKLGKLDDAAQALQDALAKAPLSLSSSLLLASVKLQAKDAKGAEEVLLKARDVAPKSADTHLVLGSLYLSQKRMGEAEAELRRAEELDPKSAAAPMALANVQLETGRKPAAEAIYKRLSVGSDRRYQFAYAIYLFQEGRRDDAVREFERLFKEYPEDRQARTRLIVAYLKTNRPQSADKVLSEALKKNPKDLDALLQRAEIFLAAGKYPQADADLNQVVRLQPGSPQVHYILGKSHLARGDRLIYRQELLKALELDPYQVAIRLDLVESLLAAKEAKSALDVIDGTPASQRELTPVVVQRNWSLWSLGDLKEMRKGIDLGLSRQRSEELLLQDGLWKLRSGDSAGARKGLEEALKIDPANLRALGGLRQSYMAQKQIPAAFVEKVREYAAQQPKSAVLQEYLGFQLMTQDRAAARAAFSAAAAADPKYVTPQFSLAQLDFADHKLDDAAARMEKVLAVDGENPTAHLWLGKIKQGQGNQEAARNEFQKAVNADPGNAEGLNNLAYLLAEYGKQPNEALKYAQKAEELEPDNPEYADTLGWVLYMKGLYSPATVQLQRAASHEGNPVWKYHLAMAYAKAGDAQHARATLNAAVKANPNLPEARIAREMLGAPVVPARQ
jgi:Tfp pilus assembly protein PilF